ncbi:hypothetical protein DBT_1295 [Dissulfuribacter thermophilus]|uniref:DUF5320 domain-containing protein n=1 Tax=Dissulfuribacter thermophilus TaxID=1156395 RepID=A0A1B9F5U2_9BACT|nr:DUF5320 domain-containing protein [Dissulfuribacter thermophilus]OCC15175.1 hypothetical protein DBT_1295 [Dissulfuribacter thermophilus]
MLGLNRMGRRGASPRTGRALGLCRGRGLGLGTSGDLSGRGNRGFRCFGFRGFWSRMFSGQAERQTLESRARALRDELRFIEDRLKGLSN